MKFFTLFTTVFAAASAAPAGPILLGHGPVLHHAVSRPAGQVSHQSVSRPGQEVRSLVQSKAFGAYHASTSQVDNSKGLYEIQPAIGAAKLVPVGPSAVVNPVLRAPVLHGAAPLVAHASPYVAHASPLVTHATPYVAHASPLVAHSSPYVAHAAPFIAHTAPVVAHAVHSSPVIAHPLAHAIAHPAPVYPEEPAPYTYEYAVADDYSKSAFNAVENADGVGNVAGSYSVALPDGRTQHVKYSANGYDGYVAEVTYEGQAVYPEEKPYAPAVVKTPAYNPIFAHAPVVAHAPIVAHPLSAVGHALAPAVAHPAPAHPLNG